MIPAKEQSHQRTSSHKKTTLKMTKPRDKPKPPKKTEEMTPSSISRHSIDSKKKKKQLTKTAHRKQNIKPSEVRLSLTHQFPKLQFRSEEDQVQSDPQLSFREYCSVEGEWIPMISGTQRERLMNLKPKGAAGERDNRGDRGQANGPVSSISDSLEQIFQNLESNCILHENSFNCISEAERKRYAGLLSNLMGKLSTNNPPPSVAESPRLSLEVDLSSSSEEEDIQNQEDAEQLSPVKLFGKSIAQQQTDPLVQADVLIQLRQESQLIVNVNTDPSLVRGFTTIFLFTEKLFNLICEGETMARVLCNIRTAEGLPRLSKLRSIIQGQTYIGASKVIPEEVLESIWRRDRLGGGETEYVNSFNKCVFDAFNDELRTLKPYYETRGESFPWSFKLAPPITFYQICEDSLGLAIFQARNKIVSAASRLCGLLVENLPQQGKERLEAHRSKRESGVIKNAIESGEEEKQMDLEIENSSTVMMVSLAEIIVGELCLEMGTWLGGKGFFQYRKST